MNDFELRLPTRIVFGRGKEALTGELVREYGTRVLLVYGSGSIKRNGIYDRVVKSLRAAGLEIYELPGVLPNPHVSLARQGIELCRHHGIDFILAVGGGSVIDTAKCICFGVNYGGDVWELYAKKGKIPNRGIPIGVILTIAAAGSELNNGSVMSNDETAQKHGIIGDTGFPVFAIMNPELTYTVSAFQTAAGAADGFSHVVNGYLVDQEDIGLQDGMAEACMRTIVENAPRAILNPHDYEARAQLMLACSFATCGILHVGCKRDGTDHRLEHELGGRYDINHGSGVAIIALGLYKYIWRRGIPRFAKLACRVFGVQYDESNPEKTAYEAIEQYERFIENIGLPTRLSQLDISDGCFEDIARSVFEYYGDFGGFGVLSQEDLLNILRLCL